METIELNNYKIKFYSEEEYYKGYEIPLNTNLWIVPALQEEDYKRKLNNSIQYAGLVSDISEDICKKVIDWLPHRHQNYDLFYEYPDKGFTNKCTNAKESFQTLSNLPYCVIKLNKNGK